MEKMVLDARGIKDISELRSKKNRMVYQNKVRPDEIWIDKDRYPFFCPFGDMQFEGIKVVIKDSAVG